MNNLQSRGLKKEDHESEKIPFAIIYKDIVKVQKKRNEYEAMSIAEALTLTKYGKFNYFLIFISGMILANIVLETVVIASILPIAQCDLLLTNIDKSLLSAMGYVGIFVSSHLWGFLADTKGRHKIMFPTLLAGFFFTLLSSFAHKFWLMAILRFINGFCVSGGSATIYAYLGEFFTDKTRSRAMMGSAFIFSTFGLVLPLIASVVLSQDYILPIAFLGIDFKPWRLYMIICGIPGFIAGVAMYFLPESPKFLLSIGQEDKAIKVLRKMSRWNGSKSELQVSHIIPEVKMNESIISRRKTNSNCLVIFLQDMWNQTAPLFNKKYLRITLIASTIQFWLYVIMNGLYMWYPHIINSMVEFMKESPGQEKTICQIVYDKHDSIYKTDGSMECITKLESSTYFYALLNEIFNVSSFALIGVIINRVEKINVLFILMIASSFFGFSAVIVPNPQISLFLFMGLFMECVGINILGLITVELYPTKLRAMSISISLMMGRLGSLVGAFVIGIILEHSCELTFFVLCGSLALSAFLALLIPRKSIETEEAEKNYNHSAASEA